LAPLRFQRIHEKNYRKFGFELAFIEPRSIAERVKTIISTANGGGIQAIFGNLLYLRRFWELFLPPCHPLCLENHDTTGRKGI
jgi:hypothetical protein